MGVLSHRGRQVSMLARERMSIGERHRDGGLR